MSVATIPRRPIEGMGVDFYSSVLKKLIARGVITTAMTVLVIAGGERDQAVLLDAGFTDVVISNLDTRISGDEFAPYSWSFQDAENLTYSDGAFDLVIIHAGLHHCHSPHRALLEMYRVSRVGALIFEARDNVFLKAATALGVSEVFELTAVRAHGCAFGGVANTQIPNYIYRWTEHEVKKTVWSYAPQHVHNIEFFYGVRTPATLKANRRPLIRVLALVLMPAVRLFVGLFPKLGNEFGIFIAKPKPLENLQPWLQADGDTVAMKRE